MTSMRDKLRQIRRNRAAHGLTSVLIELYDAVPGADGLQKLEDVGLRIDAVVGNKIIGRAAPEDVAAIKAQDAVCEVEIASRTFPKAVR